jgi:ribonuclease J
MTNNQSLKVIPLGGLGEIGKNMMAIEYGNDIIVIDVGLSFPSEEHLGVDYIIPNTEYLIDRQEKIKGIILTHGHEDHIGGINDFLRKFSISIPPIYGTKLTIGLAEDKINYRKVFEGKVDFKIISPREKINLGVFEVEILRVCHSIADSVGLAINTPLGTVIHTGDFKLDPTPIDGNLTDYFKFTEFGEKGVLLLMSDSTNVTKQGFTPSEKEVAKGLINAIGTATGRVIVTTFASNIHRVQQILNISSKFGRKIALVGRSMEKVTKKALEMGYINGTDIKFIKNTEVESYEDHELTIVTTGAQGEPMAALSRIASDEHRIRVKEGDTIVISAVPIPGNEKLVFNTINKLFSKGAEVIYEAHNNLHVSGHASSEELKMMINMTRPKYFMPIHGESRHLIHHAELAESLNIASDNIFVLNNGDVLEIFEDRAGVSEKIPANKILIDGAGVGYVEEDILKERQILSRDGVIFVSLSINNNWELISDPAIISKGFIINETNSTFYEKGSLYIRERVSKFISNKKDNVIEIDDIEKELVSITSDYAYSSTGRKPLVVPSVSIT